MCHQILKNYITRNVQQSVWGASILSLGLNRFIDNFWSAAPPDHEEEYQYSGSEEEDEQLLAGMIAEEMG